MEEAGAAVVVKPSSEIVDAMVGSFGFGENASKRAVCLLFFSFLIATNHLND